MSTLIKGMEMPTSCYKCPMSKRNGMNIICPVVHEQFSVADVNILYHRLDKCPLIPVPDNGRLIDKDALEADISESVVFSGRKQNAEIVGAKKIINRLHVAPTIIPADKEGEG